MSVMNPFTASVQNSAVASVQTDQNSNTIIITGAAPGATAVTITDARGVTASVPVRVAYNAGSIPDSASIRITGDPADSAYVKRQAIAAALARVRALPGAQVVASPDEIPGDLSLAQDDVAQIGVPVLIQGEQYFTVTGTTQVRVENVAAPKIRPAELMVSDFPERLTANGVLFSADVKRTQPSRFLYFHYNPPGEPSRRIVLRAFNGSAEPAIVQFISGQGGPGPNEMEVGHDATVRFLKHLVRNEGRILVIPARSALILGEQDLPTNDIACALLQLRVLNGSTVHLTLFSQNADASPDQPLPADAALLPGYHPHARGVYHIPEFHDSRLWNVTDPYLELPIGQIPVPNLLLGQALAGDYGVLQSFVVNIENPMPAPQSIALYENPRGGRATGTYLIDGVLVQSHQVPPFSRYKLRQYVVPAHGFIRVTIETIPDSGSSYPLRLIFAPDDGSVAPGAPGSPVY